MNKSLYKLMFFAVMFLMTIDAAMIAADPTPSALNKLREQDTQMLE